MFNITINSDDKVKLNETSLLYFRIIKRMSHRIVSFKPGFNDNLRPNVRVDLRLVLYTLLPSHIVGGGEAKCPALQQDLRNDGKVATQEREDALQFSSLLKDHQVKGDSEFWTPIFIILNKGIFFNLRNCKI